MKRNYVKVIAAVVGMTMVYCPLTLNAKSKKNATAAPSKSPFTDMERLRRSP